MEELKSTLTATEKEIVKSIVLGYGNPVPEKIDDEEYEELWGEVHGAELQAMKRQPLTDRQRDILTEESKHYKGGIDELSKNMRCNPDQLKAALGDPVAIDRLITSTIDNMQFISEVIDRYEKYAPTVESFDKIASKEDITAWIEKADKIVGNDIDDPLRQAATSLMRLNEDHYPLFLGSMEEFRKDPMLLARMYVNAARANIQDLSKNPFKDVAVTIIDADRKKMSVSLVGLDDTEHKMRVVDGMIQGGELTFANGDVVDLDYMKGHTIGDELGVPLATKIREMTYSGHVNEPELARGAGMWDYYAEHIGDLLEKNVNGKLDILLPENGDKLVLDKPFAIENAQGLKEGARIEVSEIHHVFSIDNDKDAYLCGDERGGVSTDRLYISDLQRLKTVLDEKKYTVQLSAQGQHAGLDDVLLRANELGIEFHPVGLKGDITVSDFDDGIDVSEKTFQYASVENDDIIVYENLYDVFEFNKGYSLSELPESSQASVLDRLYDSFFAENDQMVVVYDKQEVPSYALGAIINGDLSGIEDPEDEQNIRDFMDKNAGYLYEIQPDSEGFTRNPAFGLPTDCETVFMVKPVTPKELLEQKKVEAHEALDVDKTKPYTITIGTDNRPGGVEGEYHLQFKPDIMNVTFCEQEEIAKEFGGTMRVTNGQEWADFYHEADAVKFAEKVVGMNQERESIDETEDESMLEATNVSLKKDQLKALAVKLFGENAVLRTWAYPELDREVCLGDMPYTIRIDSIEIKDGELKLMSEDLGGEIEQSALHWDDVEAISAMLKEASVAYEKRHEAVDLADKVWDRLNALMPVYDDKLKVSKPFTLTYPDRSLYSGEPCKVDSVVRSLRSSNLAKDTFYFGNKKGGVEIYDMSVTDLKAHIMPFLDVKEKELSDAKTQLTGVLEAARADLGDTISIKPTPVKLVVNDFIKATGIFFAPDGEGGGEYRLLGRDSAMRSSMSFAISAEINGHKEFEVGKILDTVASFNSLAKAVRYTHIDNLEQNAKKVIHDRIVMPSARSFTDDQVAVLNRYHQMAAPDTPTVEAFSRLLKEVAKEPDVARKPDKWVTDTGKELDEIARGKAHEETQHLKR